MHTSQIYVILLMAFLLLAIIFRPDQPDILEIFGPDFRITEKTEDKNFTRFTATNGSAILKVGHARGIDVAKARQYIDEKRFGIESLYRSMPSPYPETITRTIECPDEFKPAFNMTESEHQDSFIYVLYATERFTYGACSDDLIKYRAIFYLAYCREGNEIYNIELFMHPDESVNKFVSMVQSFRC